MSYNLLYGRSSSFSWSPRPVQPGSSLFTHAWCLVHYITMASDSLIDSRTGCCVLLKPPSHVLIPKKSEWHDGQNCMERLLVGYVGTVNCAVLPLCNRMLVQKHELAIANGWTTHWQLFACTAADWICEWPWARDIRVHRLSAHALL